MHWYDCGFPKEYYKEYEELLDKYEELSIGTCIICGEEGKIDKSEYWITPLCDKCRKKIKKGEL